MGTSGVYGFYKNGVSKITYCHYDAGPDVLGNRIAKFLVDTDLKTIADIFDRIIMVDKYDAPSDEQIEECKEFYQKNFLDECEIDTDKIICSLSENTKISSDTLKSFLEHNLSSNNIYDWYWLLHKTMGDLNVYKNNCCRYMIDAKKLLNNSLYCEWGYVINLDTNKLEVYKGIQSKPQFNRYYMQDKGDGTKEYYNCHLIAEINLSDAYVFF